MKTEITEISKIIRNADILDVGKEYKNWCDITEYHDLLNKVTIYTNNNDQINNTIEQNLDNLRINAIKVQLHKDSPKSDSLIDKIPREVKVTGIYEFEKSDNIWQLPVINSLRDIPPAFYYYPGSRESGKWTDDGKGVYICISPGVIVRVPFVRVIADNVENSKHRTIACQKEKSCNNYDCTFTHPGTPFIKIGISARCPSKPGFGDLTSLARDIEDINDKDIRMLLMYALTDLFPTVSWFQKNKKETIITDLGICI